MVEQSQAAAAFLKALSHEGRLMILFYLAEQERSVTELEHCLGSRQSAVSQQLARLRHDKLVKARRAGKAVIYSIADPRVKRMISIIHDIFVPAA
ncbi:MAG: transcriptional regulator [Cereibacter sphaeroides]|uniref:Transcriptional regulator n=1 Tax=Cereibacter sphaeroides TaxID=1063 RepID=A0A2W5SKL5_CERSP|nr:MAG: transcriptional regulator [Cereibacter sphaeroides]